MSAAPGEPDTDDYVNLGWALDEIRAMEPTGVVMPTHAVIMVGYMDGDGNQCDAHLAFGNHRLGQIIASLEITKLRMWDVMHGRGDDD
jgi:hypothetical protein